MFGQVVSLCFVFIGIQCLCINAGPCPQPYARYSKDHTYCLDENSRCQILANGVSEDDKKVILNTHNKYRNKVASGEESIGSLPQASNMLQMEWDNELSVIAQKHADQCKFRHDCNECRQTQNFEVGQNIYSMGSMGEYTPDWEGAIQSWYNEVSNFNRGTISSFDSDSGTGVIGHFTQVVWANSWKVGCGLTIYKEGDDIEKFHVCNYGPGGNTDEAPIYEEGKTGSACPKNSIQTNEYPGLCKINDGKAPQYEKKFNGELLHYCDFGDTKCSVQQTGRQQCWKLYTTLSGSYAGCVLEGGQTAILNFTTEFKTNDKACFSVSYRKGPNVDGETSANTATEQYRVTKAGDDFDIPLSSDTSSFMPFGMNLGWNGFQFYLSIIFSVAEGYPAQYFEMTDITFTKGRCSS